MIKLIEVSLEPSLQPAHFSSEVEQLPEHVTVASLPLLHVVEHVDASFKRTPPLITLRLFLESFFKFFIRKLF